MTILMFTFIHNIIHLFKYSQEIIIYIAGFIVKHLMKSIIYEIYIHSLTDNNKTGKLIHLKNLFLFQFYLVHYLLLILNIKGKDIFNFNVINVSCHVRVNVTVIVIVLKIFLNIIISLNISISQLIGYTW